MTAISVIIPTKSRGTTILAAVQSIGDQSVCIDEVVIVDGSQEMSDPSIFEVILRGCPNAPGIRYIHAPEDRGLTAARNRGVKESKGQVIQFLDDDAILDPDYFYYLLKAFKSPIAGGVSGLVIEPDRKISILKKILFRVFYIGPFRQNREEIFFSNRKNIIQTNTLPGVGAYRREVFDNEKFDEKLTGSCIGEDIDFSYRVGLRTKLFIQPLSKIYHYPSPIERQSIRRIYSSKVEFYYYHYKKNLNTIPLAQVAFLWLNIGFFFHALLQFNYRAVRGVIDGWFSIAQSIVYRSLNNE